MGKAQILNDFKVINKVLKEIDFTLEIVVVGGSAFVMKDLVDRSTHDIDFLNEIDEKKYLLVKAKIRDKNIDLNNKVKIFKNHFYGWADDVVIFKKYSNLTVKTVSNELLVVSKFFTRSEDRDITEAAYSKKLSNLSQAKLENILSKMWTNINSITKQYFYDREMEVVEFYRAMG